MRRQLETEKQRIEEENRRKEAQLTALQELEERRAQELEMLKQQYEQLRLEMEERRRTEEEKRKRLEEDMHRRTIEEQNRLRQKEEERRKREEEEKKRLEDSLRRQREVAHKLLLGRKEQEELQRKLQAIEEEKKKADEKMNSLWGYLPSISVPISVPSWSWIWGSSKPPGKLVMHFSDFRIWERRGSHRKCPVWKAVRKQNEDVVALKEISKSGRMAFREPMLHHHLSHPNILSLKGVTRNEATGDIYMVLPFIEFDLDRSINAISDHLTTAQVRHLMYQIMNAVSYLHSANIVHRDLQPTSIMISHSDNRLWLTSFGRARNLSNLPLGSRAFLIEPDILPASTYLGYRAPEVILTPPHLQESLSPEDWKAADIWSCGCIFAQLIFKKPLFFGLSQDAILQSILSYSECMKTIGDMIRRFPVLNTHPATCSDEGAQRSLKDLFLSVQERVGNRQKRRPKQNIESADSTLGLMDEETREQVLDLLTLMLTFEPAQRISARDAINHPFFAPWAPAPSQQEKKKRNWTCPEDLLPKLRDENVKAFMETDCNTIV